MRLLPAAAVTWIVAGVAVTLPETAVRIAAALWIATLAALVLALRRSAAFRSGARRRSARFPEAGVVIVLALAAGASAASHVAIAMPSRTALDAWDVAGGRAVEIEAVVVGKIEPRADGTLTFDARATRLTAGARSSPVGIEVEVRVPRSGVTGDTLDVGAHVRARGTVTPARAGERAVAVVRASRGLEVLQAPTGIAAATSHLRHGLMAAVHGLGEPGAGLVPGLAVGDTAAVVPELDAAMKVSSLSHLTAVSGANCALVVGIAFAVAALLGASRRLRVAVGLATLVGFVLLVTPEPSVVRAAAMSAIAMLAVLLGRTGAGLSLLCVAVTLLLVIDPWLAGSLGFALSAAATGSLVLWARPLAAGLARGMPRALALALSVPLAAQLACGPLLILITPEIPVYGVVANLLAGPAAPLATVLGLAACVAAPIPWLQSGLAALAWLPASWIAGTALTFANLPARTLPWIDGLLGAAVLAIVGAAVGIVIATPRGGSRPMGRTRAFATVLVAVVVGTCAGIGALTSLAGRWTLPSEWTVLACDVGQGDAVLIRSADAVALIDTGPEPDALETCLARTGIDRIDLLVITHFDQDHAGGAAALHGRVGTVLHGPVDPAGARVVRELESHGARAIQAHAGMTGRLGQADWRVLWPVEDSRAFGVGNDASVVLDIRGGDVPATLLLGDLSAAPQRALAASGLLASPYAVVKVAHHGSADQHPGLYESIRASVALLTVGTDNRYGHPRDETLAFLTVQGTSVARTDEQGVIALWGSGRQVTVWRERGT